MPVSTLVSPTMLATERSISSVMMMSVMGSAISRIGAMSRSRKVTVSGLSKFGTTASATAMTITSSAITAISRVRSIRRHAGCACVR